MTRPVRCHLNPTMLKHASVHIRLVDSLWTGSVENLGWFDRVNNSCRSLCVVCLRCVCLLFSMPICSNRPGRFDLLMWTPFWVDKIGLRSTSTRSSHCKRGIPYLPCMVLCIYQPQSQHLPLHCHDALTLIISYEQKSLLAFGKAVKNYPVIAGLDCTTGHKLNSHPKKGRIPKFASATIFEPTQPSTSNLGN